MRQRVVLSKGWRWSFASFWRARWQESSGSELDGVVLAQAADCASVADVISGVEGVMAGRSTLHVHETVPSKKGWTRIR